MRTNDLLVADQRKSAILFELTPSVSKFSKRKSRPFLALLFSSRSLPCADFRTAVVQLNDCELCAGSDQRAQSHDS